MGFPKTKRGGRSTFGNDLAETSSALPKPLKATKGPKLRRSFTSSLVQSRTASEGLKREIQQVAVKYVTKVAAGEGRVSFRVDLDAAGGVAVSRIDPPPKPDLPADADSSSKELEDALAEARSRGQVLAAAILDGEEMLNADDFAELLGTSRMTINTKRRSGAVLGLAGTKRGYRFPRWQLDHNGNPYPELAELHERLGGPWAVYRFMVQPHGELNGLTGRQALERGQHRAVLDAAESVGRDFS